MVLNGFQCSSRTVGRLTIGRAASAADAEGMHRRVPWDAVKQADREAQPKPATEANGGRGEGRQVGGRQQAARRAGAEAGAGAQGGT